MARSIPNNDEEDRPAHVLRLYRDRLKNLRRGQNYSQNGNIPKAMECYSKYLNTLAKYFDVTEEELTPDLFDQEADLGELLLISNVYWDLAKTYDKNPKLALLTTKCLNQFARFTVGFKYQYANAQMLKNFITRGKAHNSKAFKQTYENVRMGSKNCFVSSYCFGHNHPTTNELRLLKAHFIKVPFGLSLVNTYYQYAPKIIVFFRLNKPLETTLLPLIKIFLKSIARIHKFIRKIYP